MNQSNNDTEMRNPRTIGLSRMDTAGMLSAMNRENYNVAQAVEEALGQIVPIVDHIVQSMQRGGRLIYVGAGTSGRIAAMDAAECPPTFGIDPDRVVALVAGGLTVLNVANAVAEDDAQLGDKDMAALHPMPVDTVVGVSASGTSAYVLTALHTANLAGAATVSLCSNRHTAMDQTARFSIVVSTGPEAVCGSTRLKAGSAQKMVLNLISTAVMTQLGYVLDNYMINFSLQNEKLHRRAVMILIELTGCTPQKAGQALQATGSVQQALATIQGEYLV